MPGIKSYRELDVWQRAMDLVAAVYRLVEELPDTERYGLRSQAQRAEVSIPSNIAEGFGRDSTADYCRLLTMARSSLMELETQLALMVRLNLADREDVVPLWEQSQTVGRMLNAFRKSLKRRLSSTKAQGPTPNPPLP